MKINRQVLLIVSFLIFFACSPSDPYSSYKIIKGSKWERSSLLTFEIDSVSFSAAEKYDVFLGIVNNSRYPYQNIWLQIGQNFKDTIIVNDSIEVTLTDERGNWMGSGNGGLFQYEIPYKTAIKLKPDKQYIVQISQIMMDDPLIGIDKIGVMVVPAKN